MVLSIFKKKYVKLFLRLKCFLVNHLNSTILNSNLKLLYNPSRKKSLPKCKKIGFRHNRPSSVRRFNGRPPSRICHFEFFSFDERFAISNVNIQLPCFKRISSCIAGVIGHTESAILNSTIS